MTSKKKFLVIAAAIAVCVMGLGAGKSKPPAQETASMLPPVMLSVSKGYDGHCVRPGWGDPLVNAFPAKGWGITQHQIDTAEMVGDRMALDPDFCQMAETAINHSIQTGRWLQMGEYPGQ